MAVAVACIWLISENEEKSCRNRQDKANTKPSHIGKGPKQKLDNGWGALLGQKIRGAMLAKGKALTSFYWCSSPVGCVLAMHFVWRWIEFAGVFYQASKWESMPHAHELNSKLLKWKFSSKMAQKSMIYVLKFEGVCIWKYLRNGIPNISSHGNLCP